MKKFELTINNKNYFLDISPYIDGVSVALSLVPNDKELYQYEDIKVVSVAPMVPPMDDSWVLLDTESFKDIENVLIENNVIETEQITTIVIGVTRYPCYQLTESAYVEYQKAVDKLMVG